MYKLLTGVNYTAGSMSLDEVEAETIADVGVAIAKIMESEKDAINFVFTVVAPDLPE